MRYIFKFPDIGEGISEGKIVEWYVRKGQEVKSGESLVKMETDKVVTDIPSPKAGTVVTLYGNEGQVINVDDPLVELEIEGVEGAEARAVASEKPKPPSSEAIDEKGFGVVGTLEVAGDGAFLPASDEGTAPVESPGKKDRKALATPVARALARDLGIDINAVTGSGPAGRVMKKDILAFRDSDSGKKEQRGTKPAAHSGERVEYRELSQIRKTIARNMARSKQTAAHMTVHDEADVSRLVAIRRRHTGTGNEEGSRISYLGFVLKAAAEALKRHPVLNSELDMEHDRLIYKRYINLGIAVDTDDGLVVPVVRDADTLSLKELSGAVVDLAERARGRRLKLDDLKDGTFTVTNYGSIAGTYGVPVINYPQVAILGTGRIMRIPVVRGDRVEPGEVMPLSLSVDHRVIDGGAAARFLRQMIDFLEDPLSMFMG